MNTIVGRHVSFFLFALIGLLTMLPSPATAVTLSYNFEMNGNGFSSSFVAANPNQTRYFHGAGTVSVSYDTDTLILHLIADSIGDIHGANANNDYDPGSILVSNVHATGDVILHDIVPGINAPGGLVGLLANGAGGSGTFTWSDIGLGNGLTSVNVMPMPMSGAQFASLPAANTDYFDLHNLGDGIYWQNIVNGPGSDFFGKLASFSWYNSMNDVIISGINFGHVHADLRASQVPEPATGALLTFGLLGAFARRKRG